MEHQPALIISREYELVKISIEPNVENCVNFLFKKYRVDFFRYATHHIQNRFVCSCELAVGDMILKFEFFLEEDSGLYNQQTIEACAKEIVKVLFEEDLNYHMLDYKLCYFGVFEKKEHVNKLNQGGLNEVKNG